MFNSNNISHAFDLQASSDDIEVLAKPEFFYAVEDMPSAIDSFGCLGSAGTMGGCFGCLATAGCCC